MTINLRMMMALLWKIILFAQIIEVISFNYEDLKEIPSSCYKQGTCQTQTRSRLDLSLDWKDSNCFCDDECIKYGDCCLNANAYDEKLMQLERPYKCVTIPMVSSFYMKGDCPSNWEDDSIEKLCLQAGPERTIFHSDPFLDVPATSLSTSTTYKNYYCALCNNENPSALQLWRAKLYCSSTLHYNKTFIEENIQYINGQWRVPVSNSSTDDLNTCDLHPFLPETVSHIVRKCQEYKSNCASTWTDKSVEDLCNSYTTLVYGPSENSTSEILNIEGKFSNDDEPLYTVYRNYHCAKCNHVNDSELVCYVRDTRWFRHNYFPVSFTVLFDFGERSSPCTDGQIWDSFSRSCRQVACFQDNFIFRNGRCEKNPSEKVLSTYISIENDTSMNSNESMNSELSCDKMFFKKSEVIFENNGSIFIKPLHLSFEENEYEINNDEILVCTQFNFPILMGWLTLVGLGLSCLCLTCHLFAFIFAPELQNISGKNLASFCFSLLCAYYCFLLSSFKSAIMDLNCKILGSLMYYFFLASFTWMNVMSFDVWRTLQLATSQLRVTAGKQWKKFIIYSLYAWFIPLVALIIVLLFDKYKPIDPSYLPELGARLCWFGQRNAILVYFAVPLACIMGMNFAFFVLAIRILYATTRSSTQISSTHPHKANLKIYGKLAILMGLSWIFGIFGGYFQNNYLWYIFILLNTLQGVFIFVTFACSKKVFRSIKRRFTRSTTLYQRSFERRISSSSPVLDSKMSSDSQLSANCSTNISNVSLKTLDGESKTKYNK